MGHLFHLLISPTFCNNTLTRIYHKLSHHTCHNYHPSSLFNYLSTVALHYGFFLPLLFPHFQSPIPFPNKTSKTASTLAAAAADHHRHHIGKATDLPARKTLQTSDQKDPRRLRRPPDRGVERPTGLLLQPRQR